MKQLSIFDVEVSQDNSNSSSNSSSNSKRLVKTDLKTQDYVILNYLKKYALGTKNKVSGRHLADVFGFENTAKIRQHIKRLRIDPTVDVIIGSDSGGYYIPTQEEYIGSVQLMLGKTLSQIATIVNMYPRAEKIIQAVAGYHFKRLDKAVEGQTQIQFNGWEREYIKRYADGYLEEKEK